MHEQLRAERGAAVARWDRRDGGFSAARGAVFLAGVGVAVGWAFDWWSGWWLVVPGVVFAGLCVIHEQIADRRAAAGRGVAHHDAALARMSGGDDPTADGGADLRPAEFPTAADLDLFGERSPFAALCSARTGPGRRTLAGWLLTPAAPNEVRDRQAAAAALAADVTFRERLARLPGERGDDLADPAAPPRPVAAWARIAAAALGVAAVAGLAWWLVFGGGVWGLLLAGGGQAALQAVHRDHVSVAAKYAGRTGGGLTLLAGVLRLLEWCEADAPAVAALRAAVTGGGSPPSAAVARLAALDRRLTNALRNQFVAVASFAFGLPLFHAHAVARWAAAHGDRLPGWADAAGRFEAMLSLARWRFERPDFAVPEVSAGPPRFRAAGLGHPLLPGCVRNDVRLSGGDDDDAPALLLVSGSNMSGKSTLLRAVGVNAALAQAGAVVCATSLSLAPCRVRSVMRIADSLADGKSLFFESVRRLAAVLEDAAAGGATGGPPVLFLLDEILQGTNSADRRTGAEAVVRTLLGRGAVGLVTTHDLALTEVADDLGDAAANVHFRDDLAGGRMTFDHRLRPGVVPRSNALELMRLVGIVE